jgi:hypothetical protein
MHLFIFVCEETEMKTYKIIVLGTSGAGKTVFLASLFNKLAIQKSGIGFFLRLPHNQKNAPVNVYNTLVDANNPSWPKGTREESQWDFTCMVQAGGKIYSTFQFTYFDYAGTVLTDNLQSGVDGFSIELQALEADAIVVLLDGQKVANSMQGKRPSSIRSLNYDLSQLLPLVQQLQNKVVHFVVTKWDILEVHYAHLQKTPNLLSPSERIVIRENELLSSGITSSQDMTQHSLLRQVREHLFQNYDDFASIIEQRRKLAQPTRLIPVSAIGTGFAQLKNIENNQVMVKVPYARPKPINVEIPLAYTIPDGFQVAHQHLQKSAWFQFRLFLYKIIQFLGLTGEFLGILAGLMPVQYRLGTTIVSGLLAFASRNIGLSRLQEQQQKIWSSIQDEKDAIPLKWCPYLWSI